MLFAVPLRSAESVTAGYAGRRATSASRDLLALLRAASSQDLIASRSPKANTAGHLFNKLLGQRYHCPQKRAGLRRRQGRSRQLLDIARGGCTVAVADLSAMPIVASLAPASRLAWFSTVVNRIAEEHLPTIRMVVNVLPVHGWEARGCRWGRSGWGCGRT